MNPAVSMWINIVLAICGALVGAGALLTPLFGSGVTQEIVSISGLGVLILSAVNSVLHGVSSSNAGPMLKFFKNGD